MSTLNFCMDRIWTPRKPDGRYSTVWRYHETSPILHSNHSIFGADYSNYDKKYLGTDLNFVKPGNGCFMLISSILRSCFPMKLSDFPLPATTPAAKMPISKGSNVHVALDSVLLFEAGGKERVEFLQAVFFVWGKLIGSEEVWQIDWASRKN